MMYFQWHVFIIHILFCKVYCCDFRIRQSLQYGYTNLLILYIGIQF